MMRLSFTVILLVTLYVTSIQSKDVLVDEQKPHEIEQIPLVPAMKKPAMPLVDLQPSQKIEQNEQEPPPQSLNGGLFNNIRFGNLMGLIPSLVNKLSNTFGPSMLRSPESFAANEKTFQSNMKLVGNEEAKLNQLSLEKNKKKQLFGGDSDPEKKQQPKPHLFGGDSDPENKHAKHLLGGETDPENKQQPKMHLLGGDSDPENDNWRGPHHAMVGGGGVDDPDHKRVRVTHLLGGVSDPDNPRNKMLMLPKLPEPQQPDEQPPKPHGILTILLLKSRNNNNNEEDKKDVLPPVAESAEHPKLILFRLRNFFGPSNDESSSTEQSSNGLVNPFALFDRMRQHFFEQQQIFDQQFNNGNEQPSPFSLDARHDALMRRLHWPSADDDDTSMPHRHSHEQPPKRKCVMLSFLRWRASVHYRTALHLLFFSGLVLFALLFVMIAMRTCRQRQQQKRGMRQLSVSTIGGEKQQSTSNMSSPGFYIFRLGSLKSTNPAERKQAEADNGMTSSLITGPLPPAPPAYDSAVSFANGGSSINSQQSRGQALVNSLVQAFKSRYEQRNNRRRQSMTSLPAYDELEKK